MLQLIINGLYAGVYCSKICELLCGICGEYQLKWPSLRCVVGQNGWKSEFSYITAFRRASGVVKRKTPFPLSEWRLVWSGYDCRISVFRGCRIVSVLNRTYRKWVLFTEIIWKCRLDTTDERERKIVEKCVVYLEFLKMSLRMCFCHFPGSKIETIRVHCNYQRSLYIVYYFISLKVVSNNI